MSDDVFNELFSLHTEAQNKSTIRIDQSSSFEIVKQINEEDRLCATYISPHLGDVAKAIDLVSEKFKSKGRLFYIGAGTSGRLGILDAAECPPTFGTKPEQVQGIMAGGRDAVFKAEEGGEDKFEQGWKDLQKVAISKDDVLCGIMASGRTPYVIGAIEKAKENAVSTIIIACNKWDKVKVKADVNICVDTGPEVIMGSTRMKAGTVQKMLLNMISTGAMIRLGKVYTNVMVDLQMNSEKLKERSKKILMILCKCDYKVAEELLARAKGHVKSAIIMYELSVNLQSARDHLKKHNGFIKSALSYK